MEKWLRGEIRWELESESEVCHSQHGHPFVCIDISESPEQSSELIITIRGLFCSNISTESCERLHWDSQQNPVSLVPVKLELGTDEIQAMWIYLLWSVAWSIQEAERSRPCRSCWFLLESSRSLCKTLVSCCFEVIWSHEPIEYTESLENTLLSIWFFFFSLKYQCLL